MKARFRTSKPASHRPIAASTLRVLMARLLRPLVRLCIRSGMTFPAFAQLLRELFVNVAEHDFALEGKEQTDSRVSPLTGINRKGWRGCAVQERRSTKRPPPRHGPAPSSPAGSLHRSSPMRKATPCHCGARRAVTHRRSSRIAFHNGPTPPGSERPVRAQFADSKNEQSAAAQYCASRASD